MLSSQISLPSDRNAGNHVIELRRRRNVGIELVLRTDQHRRRLESLEPAARRPAACSCPCNRRSRWPAPRWPRAVGSPQPEGQAHVADVARDIVVQRLHLLHVIGLALDQFSGLGLDRIVGLAPVALQECIPGSHLLPALKGRQLHRGNLVVFGLVRLLPLLGVRCPRPEGGYGSSDRCAGRPRP